MPPLTQPTQQITNTESSPLIQVGESEAVSDMNEDPLVSNSKKYIEIGLAVLVMLLVAGWWYYTSPNKGLDVASQQYSLITETKNQDVLVSNDTATTTKDLHTTKDKTMLKINYTPVVTSSKDPAVQALFVHLNEIGQKLQDSKMIDLENSTGEQDTLIDDLIETQNKLRSLDKNYINTILNIDGYGYTVSVTVNGKDIGYEGKSSFSTRLGYENSLMAEVAGLAGKENFLLKQGENVVVLSYKKESGDSSPFPLEASFELISSGVDPKTIFEITAEKKNTGVITIKFSLPLAENLKTIKISE